MKTKNKETDPGTGHQTCNPEDLQIAYQIHTLAQLVFRHMAPAQPAVGPWSPTALRPFPMSSPASSMGSIPMTWPCCP